LVALADDELPEVVREIAVGRFLECGDLLAGVTIGGEIWDLYVVEQPAPGAG